MAAQSGQYNYSRCLRRGEKVAALLALSQFVEHTQAILFLLNRRYRPYYKWTHRALSELPLLGGETAGLFTALTEGSGNCGAVIEEISSRIIRELKRQGLSTGESDFLLHHGEEIQAGIRHPGLRALHLMAE